jgi:transcriptional regulator with XRE-family HTH domain
MYVDYIVIGKRIASRRKELGYKQWEVTEKAGLSDKYISNIECGKTVLSIDTMMKICVALEITPDYLLLGSVNEKTPGDYEKLIARKFNTFDEKKLNLALGFIDWLAGYTM